MAINLTTKYAGHLEQAFSHDSYVKSHCKAKVDLLSAKSCRVYMLNTVPIVDYTRSGMSRYGTANDVQDTVVEYTMTQDKAFSGIVDKGDQSEQAISDKSGQWLRQQIRERVTPAADRYAFSRIVKFGHVEGKDSAPGKHDIVPRVYDASVYMDEHLVPESGRVLWIRAQDYPKIILSDEWKGLDSLAGKQLPTGVVGQIAGFTVIKTPTERFPKDVYMIAAHERACAFPYKINDTKIHTDPPGLSGVLIEGRQTYDLFVLASKADAVYSEVKAGLKLATPGLELSSGSASITCPGASEIWFTVDGSDPRFSMQWNPETMSGRRQYTSATPVPRVGVLKAVAFADGKFTSDVAEKTIGYGPFPVPDPSLYDCPDASGEPPMCGE